MQENILADQKILQIIVNTFIIREKPRVHKRFFIFFILFFQKRYFLALFFVQRKEIKNNYSQYVLNLSKTSRMFCFFIGKKYFSLIIFYKIFFRLKIILWKTFEPIFFW